MVKKKELKKLDKRKFAFNTFMVNDDNKYVDVVIEFTAMLDADKGLSDESTVDVFINDKKSKFKVVKDGE